LPQYFVASSVTMNHIAPSSLLVSRQNRLRHALQSE
jgi:hypothetical protein